MKITITRPIPEAGVRLLRAVHEVDVCQFDPDAPVTDEQIIEAGRDAHALLTLLSDPITENVLASCPHLKVVAQYAVGYDNIDVEAARRLGIIVTNTPGVLTDATADFAFALLLAVARRVVEADRYVREGHFARWETELLLGTDLCGKTMGIVGLGRIGAAMARRALGFGMKVIYFGRRRANLTVERLVSARRVEFEELLEKSDIISLHCALNSESRHLFDAAAFRRMKRSAILINTARGAVVDEQALVEALAAGEIWGAGLDVFEEEPRVNQGLLEQERVVVAPHLGSAATETRDRMARMCSESILAALDGAENVPHRVV